MIMSSLRTEEEVRVASHAEIEDLENQVRSGLHGRVGHFRLILSGCGLVLRGHSDSFYGKQMAQHAVMKATRLPILANEIQVG
jgi:hypothetical protein